MESVKLSARLEICCAGYEGSAGFAGLGGLHQLDLVPAQQSCGGTPLLSVQPGNIVGEVTECKTSCAGGADCELPRRGQRPGPLSDRAAGSRRV